MNIVEKLSNVMKGGEGGETIFMCRDVLHVDDRQLAMIRRAIAMVLVSDCVWREGGGGSVRSKKKLAMVRGITQRINHNLLKK